MTVAAFAAFNPFSMWPELDGRHALCTTATATAAAAHLIEHCLHLLVRERFALRAKCDRQLVRIDRPALVDVDLLKKRVKLVIVHQSALKARGHLGKPLLGEALPHAAKLALGHDGGRRRLLSFELRVRDLRRPQGLLFRFSSVSTLRFSSAMSVSVGAHTSPIGSKTSRSTSGSFASRPPPLRGPACSSPSLPCRAARASPPWRGSSVARLLPRGGGRRAADGGELSPALVGGEMAVRGFGAT